MRSLIKNLLKIISKIFDKKKEKRLNVFLIVKDVEKFCF